MEENSPKKASNVGFLAIVLGLLWLLVAQIIFIYLKETAANIFVVQLTGLLVLGIIMGFIYGKNSREKGICLLPAIIWPAYKLSKFCSDLESWIYTIWLTVVSMLLVIQGFDLGNKIKNRKKTLPGR